MAARGTGKFCEVPRWDYGCVYAVEFSNNVIKVGMTQYPQSRLYGLNQEFRKRHDAVITRYHIGPHIEKRGMLRQTERKLIDAAAKHGRAFLQTREYFEGIAFDSAVELVERVSCRFKSRKRAAMTAGAVAPQPQATEASTATAG